MNQKTVLIAAATSMVGSRVLQMALDHADVQEVRILGRKAVHQGQDEG